MIDKFTEYSLIWFIMELYICFRNPSIFIIISLFFCQFPSKPKSIDETEELTESIKKQILDLHNDIRSQVSPTAMNMLRLEWDPFLHQIAANYLQKCEVGHNKNRHEQYASLAGLTYNSQGSVWVGENIAWGSGSCKNLVNSTNCQIATDSINRWNMEKNNYDINTDKCASRCTLYTQLVWARTEKVGCAIKECPNNRTFLVCNYYPGGNYVGKRPYFSGSPCLSCPFSHPICFQRLCQTNLSMDFKTHQANRDSNIISDFSSNKTINAEKDATQIKLSTYQAIYSNKLPPIMQKMSSEDYWEIFIQNVRELVPCHNDQVAMIAKSSNSILLYNSTQYPPVVIKEMYINETNDSKYFYCFHHNFYIISSNDNLLQYNLLDSKPNPKIIQFLYCPPLKFVATDDISWILCKNGSIFSSNDQISWIIVPKPPNSNSPTSLACIFSGCWVSTSTENIFYRSKVTKVKPSGMTWTEIPGKSNEVLSSSKDILISNLKKGTKKTFFIRKSLTQEVPIGVDWVVLGGNNFVKIIAESDSLFGLDMNGQVLLSNGFQKNYLTSTSNAEASLNYNKSSISEMLEELPHKTMNNKNLVLKSRMQLDNHQAYHVLSSRNAQESWFPIDNEIHHETTVGTYHADEQRPGIFSISINHDCCYLSNSLCGINDTKCISYIECNGKEANFRTCEDGRVFDDHTKSCTFPHKEVSCQPKKASKKSDAKLLAMIRSKNFDKFRNANATKSTFNFTNKLTTKKISNFNNTLSTFVNKLILRTDGKAVKFEDKVSDLSSVRLPFVHFLQNSSKNGVLREVWFDLGNTPSLFSLFENPRFPEYPDEYLILEKFEAPSNVADGYGQRLRSYFKAKETGPHVFYISCDNQCELWISNDWTQKPKRMLTLLQYTGFRQYNKYPDQQTSEDVYMNKGNLYFLDAYMKESASSDHVSVGIRYPSGLFEMPISSSLYLVPHV